jgi:hypothetical protein
MFDETKSRWSSLRSVACHTRAKALSRFGWLLINEAYKIKACFVGEAHEAI